MMLGLPQEEAKDAFMELLASANIWADWTWEQAMRAIISDPRCGSNPLTDFGEIVHSSVPQT